MKTTIYCKSTGHNIHSFYLVNGNEEYYLFSQEYKQRVQEYFACGVYIDEAIDFSSNVWFIGTANRDESTFEISDKVYDRAQVLNFVPAKPPRQRCQPVNSTLYVSNEHLQMLFQKAKNTYSFDYATNEQIALIEDCLQEQFGVAFGNRMGKQINEFVRVYIAAGCDPNNGRNANLEKQLTLEAIDYQIANKVLRKIEYKDATDTTRYEELLALLDGLPRCQKIVNNKIKEH